MITVEYLKYEDSYKGYNPLSGFVFLDEIDNINNHFDEFLEYPIGVAEPFTDEDSERFFEYLYSIQPHKSHGFRREGAFSFFADNIIYNLTKLALDIKVVLLILKYRLDSKHNGMIINPCFLCSEPYRWLAERYDLTLYIKPSDIIHSKFHQLQNTQFQCDGEKIENIEKWLAEHVRYTREYEKTLYRIKDGEFISVFPDGPITFREFCAKLNKEMLFKLETQKIDDFCHDYTVVIHNYFHAEVNYWKNPILYGVIEKDGKGRFVQTEEMQNATVPMVFDTIIRMFKDNDADILTLIISKDIFKSIDVIDYGNLLHIVTIHRSAKLIDIADDWFKAPKILIKSMERAGISLHTLPEKLIIPV